MCYDPFPLQSSFLFPNLSTMFFPILPLVGENHMAYCDIFVRNSLSVREKFTVVLLLYYISANSLYLSSFMSKMSFSRNFRVLPLFQQAPVLQSCREPCEIKIGKKHVESKLHIREYFLL